MFRLASFQPSGRSMKQTYSTPKKLRCNRLRIPTHKTSTSVKSAEAELYPGATTSIQSQTSAKLALKRACYLTDRGAGSSSEVRGVIEEAQVVLERLGGEIDFSRLEGKWRLIYSNAGDVTNIVQLGRGTPLKVGGIFQQFSSVEEGKVQNIVEFGLPPFLEAAKGLTFQVEAGWEVRSPRRIALDFRQAGVGELRITPELEAAIAPALLPRGALQQAILLALREFRATVPLQTRARRGLGGPSYQITYLDGDMFIGRAQQGSFIFIRDRKLPRRGS